MGSGSNPGRCVNQRLHSPFGLRGSAYHESRRSTLDENTGVLTVRAGPGCRSELSERPGVRGPRCGCHPVDDVGPKRLHHYAGARRDDHTQSHHTRRARMRLSPHPEHEQDLAAAAPTANSGVVVHVGVAPDECRYRHRARRTERRPHAAVGGPRTRKGRSSEHALSRHQCAIDRVEIGYTWYAKRWQKSHVNTSCKLLLLGHAFDTLGARWWGCAPDTAITAWQRDCGAGREERRCHPPPRNASRRQCPRHRHFLATLPRVAGRSGT